MSGRIPTYLLGGINKTQNFLGLRLIQTSLYTLVEGGLHFVPFFMIMGYSYGNLHRVKAVEECLDEEKLSEREVPVRRSDFK
eukprot:CAMPEP_0116886428 /NCGR_PEP_ID=MMETSP0463-20121206/20281_1 /TAXON_ID=181622 /ORGANISM="Strombidinopsis sp, Strain SopsisLIS2011" /LENGTH=81 /DNA_ID=CAMNT_0004546845 /DNA_START=20 /DNA_END=265 /DNA_ORIENTATION=+